MALRSASSYRHIACIIPLSSSHTSAPPVWINFNICICICFYRRIRNIASSCGAVFRWQSMPCHRICRKRYQWDRKLSEVQSQSVIMRRCRDWFISAEPSSSEINGPVPTSIILMFFWGLFRVIIRIDHTITLESLSCWLIVRRAQFKYLASFLFSTKTQKSNRKSA